MSTVENMAVTDMSVASRLSSPVVNTVIDTQKISFARYLGQCRGRGTIVLAVGGGALLC